MSTLRVNNITDTSGGSTNITIANGAKVWVNFNGTGTVAIRASFNVSSITDNGTGDYTVNFTNAMTDANYAVSFSNSDIISGNYIAKIIAANGTSAPTTMTTTALRIGWGTTPGSGDSFTFSVTIFR